MMLEIHVPSVPVAQPRQRQRVIHRHGKAIAANYTPTSDPVNAFKAAVRLAAHDAYNGGAPLDGPLRVDYTFVLPRPKGMIWKRKPMPRERHIKAPDRDNLEKAVSDALNRLVWRDDAQVCAGSVEKWIAAGDEQPHVEIRIEVLA